MDYVRHPDQPTTTDIKIVDGVFVKTMQCRHAGMVLPQHAHSYDHLSVIAAGAVRVFADDRLMGHFEAPHSLVIKARVKHRFETLVPGVLILCIHNARRAEDGEVAIHEEHHLSFVEA